jgi:hypothetical protein
MEKNPGKAEWPQNKTNFNSTAIALSSGCQKSADSFTNLGIISV